MVKKRTVTRQATKAVKPSAKVGRFVYWTPRILGLVFVAFLMLFSLDVFDSATTASDIAIGLFMHNIPALILLAVVIIAWRHELVGAIVFALFSLWYITQLAVTVAMNPGTDMNAGMAIAWSLQISGPALLTAILFFIGWRRKRKK
jgi:hypothetical protein